MRYAVHSYPLRIDQEDRSSSQASVYPRSLSLSLLAATEAFHRISIIILAHGTFYTSVRVIMCDGRAAAIERGINNHLITPGQLMLARRINMREGEIGIYASTSEKEEEDQSMVKRFKWTLFGHRDTQRSTIPQHLFHVSRGRWNQLRDAPPFTRIHHYVFLSHYLGVD